MEIKAQDSIFSPTVRGETCRKAQNLNVFLKVPDGMGVKKSVMVMSNFNQSFEYENVKILIRQLVMW